MKITIVVPSGKRMTIDADPEMLGYEIPEQLIEAGVLDSLNDSNASYLVSFKEKNHQQLDMDRSLEANGVVENDALVITTSAVA